MDVQINARLSIMFRRFGPGAVCGTMKILRFALVLVLVAGFTACQQTHSSPAPSAPSPVAPAQPVPTAPFLVTGRVFDTTLRSLGGAVVEVLDGPQAGVSTIADAAGAFSLMGTFDPTTRFRASSDGHVAATQTFSAIAVSKSISFLLDVVGGSVNIAGDYTVTFIADSACAGQLPNDERTRTYTARIAADPSAMHPANTRFTATLGGAELDSYYNRILILVAGDYLDFDLSDNIVIEEVSEGAYLAIGGGGLEFNWGIRPGDNLRDFPGGV